MKRFPIRCIYKIVWGPHAGIVRNGCALKRQFSIHPSSYPIPPRLDCCSCVFEPLPLTLVQCMPSTVGPLEWFARRHLSCLELQARTPSFARSFTLGCRCLGVASKVAFVSLIGECSCVVAGQYLVSHLVREILLVSSMLGLPHGNKFATFYAVLLILARATLRHISLKVCQPRMKLDLET